LTFLNIRGILTCEDLQYVGCFYIRGTIQVAEDKKSKRKPRIRKTETVRERSVKQTAKAEAKANKVPKRRVRRTVARAASVAKPLSKPFWFITWPFRTRPMRAIGRVVGRMLWPRYFRNAWKELRLVTWPSRKNTWKLTLAVLVFAFLFGMLAAGVDKILDNVIRRIVFRS
jgi:preprotein translocase SecE subunit